MTLLEAIKKSEERQKTLDENIVKVYIRRKHWKNVIDPVDFVWMYYVSELSFHKTNIEFKPNKDDVINNDWGLFICRSSSKAENKDNKDSRPESTSIPKENITNSIKQVGFAKERLEKLLEDAVEIKKMFEKNYGINFNYFVKNPTILSDRESSVLYFFAEVTRTAIKEINDYLNKAIVEIDESKLSKGTNN